MLVETPTSVYRLTGNPEGFVLEKLLLKCDISFSGVPTGDVARGDTVELYECGGGYRFRLLKDGKEIRMTSGRAWTRKRLIMRIRTKEILRVPKFKLLAILIALKS